MYIPHMFRNGDRDELVAFMRSNSFGTLISVVDGAPLVSHIPMVIHDDGDAVSIRGHLARANAQHEAFDGREALAIFQGPHAYISPSLYEKVESVPTWNYIAVHAAGVPEPVHYGDAGAEIEALLADMIATYEPSYQAQWDALGERFKHGMLRGVVGFRMRVRRLEGKYKLSQNRSSADRERVAHALLAGRDAAGQGIGEAMLRALSEHGD
jgi:transcriptional regulator